MTGLEGKRVVGIAMPRCPRADACGL